jgi:hypothetical protein
MINPEILEIARNEVLRKSNSALRKDLMSIRKRISLSSGIFPFLWLSFNNNTWICNGEFDMDVMPESDEDKQAYVD